MKKFFLVCFTIVLLQSVYSIDNVQSKHVYGPDYSLFPDIAYRDLYIKKLTNRYSVSYCFQSVMEIPKAEIKGYSCRDILDRLDQMGGLEKECYGVSYIDGNTGVRKPIFKKSRFDRSCNELYVKDKAAGNLYFDVQIDRFTNANSIYAVSAVLNKTPSNIFVRELKKNEATIFVLMNETPDTVQLYVLAQSHFSPLKHKIVTSVIESAISGRVEAIQNWFYRMLCSEH